MNKTNMSVIQPSRDIITLLREVKDVLFGNVIFGKKLAREATLSGLNDKFTTGQTVSSEALSVVPAADYNMSYFGDFRTVEITPNMNLKSIYGLSQLRDRTVTTGTGVVEDSFVTGSGEYRLATAANGADSAALFSTERGRYEAGFTAICGMGVRIPDTTLTGNQVIYWGLGEDPTDPAANGFFFGLDANGLFVSLFRNGVETQVRQVDWNGAEQSADLDLTDGNIFQIEFSWYGYGIIQFIFLNQTAPDIISLPVVMHTVRLQGSTSITNPNLPISIFLANNGTADTLEAFVGGRQYSIRGKVDVQQRQTSERVLSATVGGTLIPLISLQRKAAYRSASIKLANFEILTDTQLLVEVRFNPVLTGAVFGTPTNTLADETAVESDVSATSSAGGLLITTSLVAANTRQSESISKGVLPEIDIPSNNVTDGIVTLLAYAPGGGPATVSALLKITEEW